jgi:hypothetical protein
MRIAELVESLDLPQTQIAERAWEDGRRRVRRRRGAMAAGAAALAVTCVVGVTVMLRPEHTTPPSPTPSPTHTPAPRSAPLVQELLRDGRWRAELADMDYQALAANLDHTTSLSTDPVHRAALAMADPGDEAGAFVLGVDGRWRRVDVPGLVPVHHSGSYTSHALRPTALSDDATKLALAQPNELVVVDLTTGNSRRYDVPGPGNTYAIWADSDQVLVVQGGAHHGTMVDLQDGSLSSAPYGPSTRFAGDTALTWEDSQTCDYGLCSKLRWSDGLVVRTRAHNGAGLFPQPPLVRGHLVVGMGGVLFSQLHHPGLGTASGFEVVDGATGKLLAYLPISYNASLTGQLLGWDGDRPIIGVAIPQESVRMFTFAWDWRAGALDPVAVAPGPGISRGTGQVTE